MEDRFKMVASCQYSAEAHIYKGKLENAGIEVFLRDNFTIDSNPLMSNAVGGIKVYVNQNDFLKAKHILSDISEFSVGDEGQPIACPKCGAEKIELVTCVKDKKSLFHFLISFFMGILPLHTRHIYKCEDCNFEFEPK